MTLLLPLGLLGLLAIAALILIYIIKPNYQQKFISSTYVWKLSMKYRKKKIPINRLKNIILFICQVLIIVSCAMLLAWPVIRAEVEVVTNEKVAIIDASASMMVESDGETRFERAVDGVKQFARENADNGGLTSVIIASDKPYFLIQRSSPETVAELNALLEELVLPDSFKCTFASADMEAAVLLSEEVVERNPDAEVVLFTATEYIDKGRIRVVDVSHQDDWNAAVLDCKAVLEDGYYTFMIEVGCFGKSKELDIVCDVVKYNGTNDTQRLIRYSERFDIGLQKKTIEFKTKPEAGEDVSSAIYSFDYVYVHLDDGGSVVDDSFVNDNTYYIYGGTKPKLRVQYASSTDNTFIRTAIQSVKSSYENSWSIDFVTVRSGEEFKTAGYDFYIFEHSAMPDKMPTDGVVMLVNPSKAPQGAGIRLGNDISVAIGTTVASGKTHPVTSHLQPDLTTVSKYRRISSHDGYDELLFVQGDPVLLVKNTEIEKHLVLSIDLNYSNMGVLWSFTLFFADLFNYYMPPTVGSGSFEVGDTVKLNAKGTELSVRNPANEETKLNEFPAELRVAVPGTYTLTQTYYSEVIVDMFYVSIANFESEITKEVDALPVLNVGKRTEREDKDLLIYIAAALVALLFVECWLQSPDYF